MERVETVVIGGGQAGLAPQNGSQRAVAAKAKPGALTFSSSGDASPSRMCIELIKQEAGIDLVHVPYKGAPPAMQAVLAEEVSMYCGPIFQGLPHVKSGKLKALGVTGAKPSGPVNGGAFGRPFFDAARMT